MQNKYQMKPPLPFVPGAEYAGVVQAVGEGVTHLQVGQNVACPQARAVLAPTRWHLRRCACPAAGFRACRCRRLHHDLCHPHHA